MELDEKRCIDFCFQWHLTDECINRCKHCYMYTDEPLNVATTFKQQLEILNRLSAFENDYNISFPFFILTGGDPFCHPDFEKLVIELKSRKKEICILGIPERLIKENVDMLLKNGIASYQVSLDGMEEIHDNIRGIGSFKRTIDALKMWSGKLDLRIMYTLSKENYNDLFILIEYLDSERIMACFTFDFLVYQGNAKTQLENLFDHSRIKELFDHYLDEKRKLVARGSTLFLTDKSKLLIAYQQSLNPNKDAGDYLSNQESIFSFCGGCYNGISSIAILPNGDVYPCRRLPIKVGNLLTDSFEDIFLSNVLMRKFRRREYYVACKTCVYYSICRGGCPAVTFSICQDPFEAYPHCFIEKTTGKKNASEFYQSVPRVGCDNAQEMKYIIDSYQNVRLNITTHGNIIKLARLKGKHLSSE